MTGTTVTQDDLFDRCVFGTVIENRELSGIGTAFLVFDGEHIITRGQVRECIRSLVSTSAQFITDRITYWRVHGISAVIGRANGFCFKIINRVIHPLQSAGQKENWSGWSSYPLMYSLYLKIERAGAFLTPF